MNKLLSLIESIENNDYSNFYISENVITTRKIYNSFRQLLNETKTTKDMLDKFVSFATDQLKLEKKPVVQILGPNETSFGSYNPTTKEIGICIKNRHPMDVFRTLAHEIFHYKQDCDGRIKNVEQEGSTGSEIENEANAQAGVIMRHYAKTNPKMFLEAIFIVGGPGSGKDMVLKKMMLKEEYHEVSFDNASNLKYPKILINGNINLERIKELKEEYESKGYKTCLIYVSVSNETSKERNMNHTRQLNETVRHAKWLSSKDSMKDLYELFDKFLVVNNDYKLTEETTMSFEIKMLDYYDQLRAMMNEALEWGKDETVAKYVADTPGQNLDFKKEIKKTKIKNYKYMSIKEDQLPDNANIREWALKLETQKKFLNRYSTVEMAENKLLETCFRLANTFGTTTKRTKKTLAQFKKGN